MCFVYKAQSKQKASKQVIIGKKKCSLTIQVLSLFLKIIAKSNILLSCSVEAFCGMVSRIRMSVQKRHGNRLETAAMLMNY